MAAMPRLRLFVAFCAATPLLVFAQAPATGNGAAGKACVVAKEAQSPADKLVRQRKYDAAIEAYRASLTEAKSNDDKAAARAGLIHALISASRVQEALDEAAAAQKEMPDNAVVLEAVGAARYRHGETMEAAKAWNAATHADPCNARVHFDMSNYLRLNGMYASSQRQIDIGRKLTGAKPVVRTAAATPTQYDAVAERLSKQLDNPDLSPEERKRIEQTIAIAKVHSRGSCELVTPVPSTKLPMFALSNGPGRIYGAGMTIELNGKKKRFQVDTGASGLAISRAAAQSAGITSEAKSQSGGVGDEGPASTNLAHVDKIVIGNMEFHNCLVHYFDKKSTLEDLDGLVGPDIFSNYVVTFDFPSREMRLDPLPAVPSETETATHGLQTAGDSQEARAQLRDRYVSPEMQDWTKVFRYGHMLILPTKLNGGPSRLFIMDTGATRSVIAPEAASAVTSTRDVSDMVTFHGIAGKVASVNAAEKVTLEFANVKQPVEGMASFNAVGLRSSGVDVSGLIGFDALYTLIISIDYRDNLVNFTKDKNKGFHPMVGQGR